MSLLTETQISVKLPLIIYYFQAMSYKYLFVVMEKFVLISIDLTSTRHLYFLNLRELIFSRFWSFININCNNIFHEEKLLTQELNNIKNYESCFVTFFFGKYCWTAIFLTLQPLLPQTLLSNICW